MQMATLRSFALSSRASGKLCLPFFRTKCTELPVNCCEMPFNMRVHVTLRLRFDTIITFFGCLSATMEKVWKQTFLRKADSPDIGDCRVSVNVRSKSARDWISGAKPEPARKFN